MKLKKNQFSWVHDNLNLVALLLAFFGMFFFLVLQQISDECTVSPLETSAIIAAHEIAAVVIDDHYFGRVGLCNGPGLLSSASHAEQPALSKQRADLRPVRSLNSIMASVRLQFIVADLLASKSLKFRAQRDYVQACRAAANLERALSLSLSPACKESFFDAYGRKVTPLETALVAYKEAQLASNRAGLGKNSLLNKNSEAMPSFSLCWSDTEGATTSHIPAPYKFAFCDATQEQNDMYRPGVNVSYGNRPFYFAAIGNAPEFINASATHEADGIHFSSLVCAKIKHWSIAKSASTRTVCIQPAVIDTTDTKKEFQIELPQNYHSSTKLSHFCRDKLSEKFSDWLASSGGRVNIESLVETLSKEITSPNVAVTPIALQIDNSGLVSTVPGQLPSPFDSKKADSVKTLKPNRPLAITPYRQDKRKSFLR